MKKSHIVNNIEKYYLGGLSKSVLWEVADKKVTINFSTEAKNAVGTLSFDLDLPDCTLAIYNTDALLRLINVTNEDIDIIISEDNQKIKIQDNKFDLIYHLSEKDAIPTVPKVTETDYDFKFNVNDEFINKFLKAHNALEKTEEVTLNSISIKGDDVVEIVLGERSQHSHKIKFTEPAIFDTPSTLLPFPANVLREILAANKGTEGTIYVSDKGLMKLEFNGNKNPSKYFVVRQQM